MVSGTIAAGASQLATYRIEESAEWARALFIEALERAGVDVAAEPSGPNDQSAIPAPDSYPTDQRLASLESPTIAQMGTMIMEMSYNVGANSFMCLLAVESGSDDCIARPRHRLRPRRARPASTPTSSSWPMAKERTRPRRRHAR